MEGQEGGGREKGVGERLGRGEEGREREGRGKGRKSDTLRYCDLHD